MNVWQRRWLITRLKQATAPARIGCAHSARPPRTAEYRNAAMPRCLWRSSTSERTCEYFLAARWGRPAHLPIEASTKFYWATNLKAAKLLSLPTSLLLPPILVATRLHGCACRSMGQCALQFGEMTRCGLPWPLWAGVGHPFGGSVEYHRLSVRGGATFGELVLA
jgi:hypothetical protein